MAPLPTGDEREGGFLQKNERAYLAEQGCYPLPYSEEFKSGGEQAHSRIKNEVATVEGMRQILSGMDIDLHAVLLFMSREEDMNWKRWADFTLPEVKHEMKDLRDTLDRLIEIAEDDTLQSEYNELQEATSNLYENVDRATEGFSGGVLGHIPDAKGSTSEFVWEEFEDRKGRQEGFLALLEYEEALDILKHIANEGPCSLSGRRTNGNETWGSFAYREFAERGLVVRKTEDVGVGNDVEYEITDAGEAVIETWEQLKQTTAVEMERETQPKASDRKLVRDALDYHFDLSGEPVFPF